MGGFQDPVQAVAVLEEYCLRHHPGTWMPIWRGHPDLKRLARIAGLPEPGTDTRVADLCYRIMAGLKTRGLP